MHKIILRKKQQQQEQTTNQIKSDLLGFSGVEMIQLDQGNVMGMFNWVVFLMKDYPFHREFLTL